ncbi:MAG: efflux RND transporter permease subunit [Cyanobacteria bacterium P01_E01_bin.35]
MKTAPTSLSISAVAVRRHIGTLMLTLAVIVIGIFFLFNIQVDLLPSITYPRIGLRADVPGISPEVAVEEVTRPLEEGLAATEGVVQVFSQTREGRVSVDLYFQPGGNIDRALNDATAAFNRARANLPDTIESPRLFKFDPSQLPIYELALTSPSLSPQQLRVFADEELARELGVIEGVAIADVSGGVESEVRVVIDLSRLQALGLGLNDVLTELAETNQDISGGRILGEFGEPLTRIKGRFQDAAEILNLSFGVNSSGTSSPRRVYLRDFAQVIDGQANQRIFVNLNQQPAVKISIQKQPEANTIEVINSIKQRLQQLRSTGVIPDDLELVATLDESILIHNAISNVTNAGLIGAFLAAIAVLLFLGSLRQTAIVVLAIPLAALTAIILMKLFGLSLNVFSLGGLAVGVGIVVDNSIVMLENIAENAGMTPGKDAKTRFTDRQLIESTISSSQEVESALVASTSTNLVSVLPFLLIGGFISLLFNELVLTVSFAIAASVLIALTVVPMLASRLLTIGKSSRIGRWGILQIFNRQFTAVTNSYGALLKQVVHRRLIILGLTFLLLGGSSILIFGQVPQEILPRINTGQARLFAQFPPGTTLSTNRRVMQKVDQILLAQPETEYVFTTAGGFLFGGNTSENLLRGSSTITLKPDTDVEAFVSRVSAEFDQLNLVDIRLRISPGQVRGLILNNSPVGGADVDLVLQGEDAQVLEQAGQQVLNTLQQQATLSRFRPDADPRQAEIQIRLDRERAAELNLNIQDVGSTLETAIAGSVATQLQRGERLVDVRVELAEAAISQQEQLKQIPLFNSQINSQSDMSSDLNPQRLIRLGDIAKIELGTAPGEIQRINQRQVFLISGSLNENANLGDALAELEQIFQGINLPQGVSRLPSAAAQSNQSIQSSFSILGGLAAFLVFVVMAVQYNSLVDPLVIMFTLPLALAGGIWGLYLTHTAIGITVIVGAVLLVGIVVNNAIILVELANQIRLKKQVDSTTAILLAAPQRLRPILMTTITTVLGMFPLALGLGQGGEFLQPLGIVVFSGLALATLLTLFIIPCLYILLHDLVNRIFGQRRSPIVTKHNKI